MTKVSGTISYSQPSGSIAYTQPSGSIAYTQPSGVVVVNPIERTAFAPTDLSGFELWLNTDNVTTSTYNSKTVVSGAADQSGNGYDYDQDTGAARPELVPNALNGKAVIRFNGSSHFLERVSGKHDLETWHIFIVSNNITYVLGRVVSNKDYISLYNVNIWGRGDLDTWSLNFSSSMDYHIFEIVIDQGADTVCGWIDNVASLSNPDTFIDVNEFNAIGIYRGGLAYGIGDLAAMLIYQDIKTGDDRNNLLTYLSYEYNISL